MKALLHFAEDGDTSGFFPQLAVWHDRSRYRMSFGTLKPMAPWLREFMEARGVRCFSCGCVNRRSYALGFLRLARYLKRERIDILHAHLFDPAVVGLAAGFFARTPVRILTRHHSDYHTRIDKRWHVRLDRMTTRLSHAVVAVSEHTREHMIEREAAPPHKVVTVHNGIDFERVKVSRGDAGTRVRRNFGAEDAYLLLMVGRLHPEKGYPHLFRAMADVKRRTDRPVKLLVAGTGPLLETFRKETEVIGCADVVQFLGFRRDVHDLMAAADVVVHPAAAEAFGLAVAEALYVGTPIVASRVGGIPEIVRDGLDGVLVPPADPPALADAIVALLHDPGRRQAMTGFGRQRVAERFRFERMIREYEVIYERAAA